MPTITVKNIPDDLYQQLKAAAEINRRSINSEIIICLERVLQRPPVTAELTLTRARQLREKTAKYPISDSEFATTKKVGRL